MSRLFSNNSTSLLAATLAVDGTSIDVTTGTGGVFPSPVDPDYVDLTLEDTNGIIEIVRCSSRSTDTLTLSARGLEGTAPAAFDIGTRVEVRLTAAALNGWLQEDDILAGGTY